MSRRKRCEQMLPVIVLALYGFAWGLRRGASACMALCVPSIIPTITRAKDGWWGGFKVALLFNIPRIVALTILGAVMGAAGYFFRSGLESFGTGSTLWVIGYAIIGLAMLGYGAYTFASATDRLADAEEGRSECSGPSHPIFSRMKFATPRSKSGLLLWGGMVSLACIGETVLAIEGILVGYAGGGAGDWVGGAIIGGFVLFMFALGTALPSLLLGSLGGSLAERGKDRKKIIQVERVAGALMMAFGVLLLMSSLFWIR